MYTFQINNFIVCDYEEEKSESLFRILETARMWMIPTFIKDVTDRMISKDMYSIINYARDAELQHHDDMVKTLHETIIENSNEICSYCEVYSYYEEACKQASSCQDMPFPPGPTCCYHKFTSRKSVCNGSNPKCCIHRRVSDEFSLGPEDTKYVASVLKGSGKIGV
jgi:hypothetical protein